MSKSKNRKYENVYVNYISYLVYFMFFWYIACDILNVRKEGNSYVLKSFLQRGGA